MSERSPAADPAGQIERLCAEVAALRDRVDAIARHFDERSDTVAQLQARLQASEDARRQLFEQMQHLLALLGDSRTELNALRQRQA